MGFEDNELDNLAQYRDIARAKRDTAKQLLQTATERRDSLRKRIRPQIDALTGECDRLKSAIDECFATSQNAYAARDYDTMRYWKTRAHEVLIPRLRVMKAERANCLEELKRASAAWQAVLEEYRKARDEHERRKTAFSVRLEYLKGEAARKRKVREQEQEDGRKSKEMRKAIAKAIVSTAFTVHGVTTEPAQNSDTTQHNWSGSSARYEANRQVRAIRSGSQDKASRRDGTSQQD